MRHLVVLMAALTTMACSPAAVRHGEVAVTQSAKFIGANTHEASMTATKEFLLTSAATDFHAHPLAETLRFYNVRIGHLVTSDGSKRYMLCGEVSSGQGSGSGDRTPFVTIDSPGGPNGYQQLLGGTSPCDNPSATFDTASDLSSSLQSRFDSL